MELLAKLSGYISIMPDAVLSRLELHAEKILSDSKKEVPWDTTHLMQTGTVEPYKDNEINGYQIGYNAMISNRWGEGANVNYGLIQHEDLTLHHPKPGTKAKFLEDPFNQHKDLIIPDLVSYIDEAFNQGIPQMESMLKSKRISLGNLGGRFI